MALALYADARPMSRARAPLVWVPVHGAHAGFLDQIRRHELGGSRFSWVGTGTTESHAMLFDREVTRALRYVNQGLGVRIVGAPGSGRTTVAKGLVSALEATRPRVYSIFAGPALASVPFAGIASLGLDLRARTVGVVALADALAEHLARLGPAAIVVDDVDRLDRESLSILHLVRERTEARMIITTGDAPSRLPSAAEIVRDWATATVPLRPLRYEQVNDLAAGMLGAPVDVDLLARVLGSSGGNLRLAARILETARWSERIALRDGAWRITGATLLNVHLHGTVEALLLDLSAEELQALNTLAVLGPSPVAVLTDTIEPELLDRLEHRGLVAGTAGPAGEVVAAVFPPLVEDYLNDRMASTGKIFRRSVSRAHKDPAPSSDPPIHPESSGLAALRAEMRRSHVPAARLFHQRLEQLEHSYFRAWEADQSMANAVAFLRVYWGAPVDRQRISRVFETTRAAGSDPADRLFFAMTRSLWEALSSNGLAAAHQTLAQLAEAEPDAAAEASAWSLLLEAFYRGMPEALDEQLHSLRSDHRSTGVTAIATAIFELYRFNPEGALRAIETTAGFKSLPGLEALVRGLAMFALGRIDEALHFALERRREALDHVDQFTLVTQSYTAALCLLYKGLFEEADYLMGSAFSMGRPGFLLHSFQHAMLRLSSLRPTATRPLADMAPADSRDVGPLPGIGRGVFDLVTRRPASSDDFDHEASQLMDKQLERGFVFEAVCSGLFFLCLLPGPGVLARLQRIFAERGATQHDQLLGVAAAVLDDDLARLVGLLNAYRRDADAYQISMLLRAAANDHRRRGRARAADGIEHVAGEFATRFPPGGQFMPFEPRASVNLTDREKQVALMAGHAGNLEIARRLGVGVRTVESHISSALRKTRTASRRALFEVVRSALEQ
ncbi:MAG: transcriptional regulator [Sinomonas sp.]|nr:transcriptional regulator [Sinomonas sp.]